MKRKIYTVICAIVFLVTLGFGALIVFYTATGRTHLFVGMALLTLVVFNLVIDGKILWKAWRFYGKSKKV